MTQSVRDLFQLSHALRYAGLILACNPYSPNGFLSLCGAQLFLDGLVHPKCSTLYYYLPWYVFFATSMSQFCRGQLDWTVFKYIFLCWSRNFWLEWGVIQFVLKRMNGVDLSIKEWPARKDPTGWPTGKESRRSCANPHRVDMLAHAKTPCCVDAYA